MRVCERLFGKIEKLIHCRAKRSEGHQHSHDSRDTSSEITSVESQVWPRHVRNKNLLAIFLFKALNHPRNVALVLATRKIKKVSALLFLPVSSVSTSSSRFPFPRKSPSLLVVLLPPMHTSPVRNIYLNAAVSAKWRNALFALFNVY